MQEAGEEEEEEEEECAREDAEEASIGGRHIASVEGALRAVCVGETLREAPRQ